MPLGRTFSVKESAELLKVSTKTIRRYLKKGILRCRIIEGKHGEEIRIFQQSLDNVLGQYDAMSKGKKEVMELNRLFAQASTEVKEVVLKILRSTEEPEEKPKKQNGLFTSIFKRG